jgi:hypothetical protein
MKKEHLNIHDYQVYEGNTDWFTRDAEKFLEAMSEDIAKFEPHTVILSAEQMFRNFSSSSDVTLSSFLQKYFSEVLVIAYIKSPITNYLSSLSQSLRTGVDNLSPQHRPIKSTINYYEDQFPGCIKLHAFDRKQLVNGDVLNDFLAKYLPDTIPLLNEKKISRSNVSLSWPLLITLRKLRIQAQPSEKKPSLNTRMLLARAAKENQRIITPQSNIKPELKPLVSNYLVESASDFLWLQKKYGITFPDLEYDKIKPEGTSSNEQSLPSNLDEIIDTSNIDTLNINASWHQKKGASYYLSYYSFIFRLRLKRIINLYFRDILSLRHKIKS